jgi:hypothetical protein
VDEEIRKRLEPQYAALLVLLLVALPLVVPLADLQVSEEVIQDHLHPE